jgi:hypothetical protein
VFARPYFYLLDVMRKGRFSTQYQGETL